MKTFTLPRIKARHRRIWALIKENRFRLYLSIVSSILVAATTGATALLIKNVIDDIFIAKDAAMLWKLPYVVIILFLVRGVGLYGQEYFMSYVGLNIIKSLRDSLYDRIQDLPLAFFQRMKTGVLMSRVTNDVALIRSMVSDAVKAAFRDFFTIIGLTVVIFYRDWKLALIAIIILPAAFFPVFEFGQRVRRFTTRGQEAMADLFAFLHETFAGAKIVKAFGMESHEKKRFFKKNLRLFDFEIQAVVAKALSPAIMELLAGVGIAFIIWYGGKSVFEGTSTLGTFSSFIGAVLMLYDPVKKISRVNNAIQEGLAAADRIFDVLETESDIRDPERPVTLTPGPHSVTFKDVSFTYAGVDTPVLKNINLDVAAGEILALVGMSGGGKTSLVNLIPRFFDVGGGAVLIDGIDIRHAAVVSLRSQIAIVTQEPILFNDTVRNNIAYGNPDATTEAVENAARSAYAYDFVQTFPNKFDTTIGELGSRLSGGEKQRICIARALLKDAPILILDEATSSLDAESEKLVQMALENLMRGRTTFVIAHRLSTIAYAHRIIVIAGGRIVEEGRHDDLMSRRGEYFKLYQMQFANEIQEELNPAG
ncbi:MAG: ABC transporter transmembrane domain-containing protein [Thermodesulfobacteriota bacterium]